MLILLKGLIWSGTGKSFLLRGSQCHFRTVCLWGNGLNKQWNSLTIKKKIFYTVVLQPFLKENGSWGGNWKEHIIFREMQCNKNILASVVNCLGHFFPYCWLFFTDTLVSLSSPNFFQKCKAFHISFTSKCFTS